MRIVHLADSGPEAPSPDGALASIATLQSLDTESEHLLIGLGTPDIREHARRFGARVDEIVPARAALTRSPTNRLRKMIEQLGPVDSIQPWSSDAADRAARLSDLTPMLPPAPGGCPIIEEHASTEARTCWRERFELEEHEYAVALITDDTAPSVAGTFGMILPPVTCTFQDRTIVGLVPRTSAGDGTTRARRYAESAGEVWRIELLEAPLHAIASASDAVLLPGSPLNDSPWAGSSATLYAARCAKRLSIPLVCAGFGDTKSKPLISGALEPTRAGNVGIAAALVLALTGQAAPDETNADESQELDAPRWIAQWRRSLATGCAV